METQEALNQYYAHYNEDNRLRSQHGLVEYRTTMRFIQQYLRPGMRVLEIGAATGRYSHALARMGYPVDAVELVEHNIEIFKANTRPGEPVTITQGNAMDLSAFGDNTYHITLLLGPMYHLFTEGEKLQALSEAIRVTRPGGIVFAAYCMADISILHYGFAGGNIHRLIAEGLVDPVTFRAFSNPEELFELHRKEDIDALRGHFPVTQLHFVATDGYTNHMRGVVDGMDPATFETYLQYHFATCERQDLVGLSHHTLDIFRKEGE